MCAMRRIHTDREYEAELARLRERLLLMGAKVEEMIAQSIRALVDRDTALAERMIDYDNEVDRLEVETDELCMRILARRQPVASDLRTLTTALKLVTDLERISDLGVNICERVIELNEEPPLKPYIDIPRMAEVAQGMVRDALAAFVDADSERAEQVIDRDAEVDAFHAQIFRELLTYMMEDPRNISRATKVQAIAKYLERIGDHATNLAEMVIFMARGKDIRHLRPQAPDGEGRWPHGILFVCTRNAARSQMAEGWARRLFPHRVRVWSAGTQPAPIVNPYAVKVMREVGIDISAQKPKSVADVPHGDIDTVVLLCDDDECPLVPGEKRREHWPLPDPAAVTGSEDEITAAFRRVRDELKERIRALLPAQGLALRGEL